MIDQRLARRYAKALYRVAVQSNMVAAVESDLDGVQGLIDADEKFKTLLLSPQFARETKEKVLEKAFSDRVTGVTMQLLRILLAKRRESEFSAVRDEFIQIRREQGKVLYAKITSSEPLSNDQRDRILEKLTKETGKTVEPEFEVNPSVIGGVKVSYDNFVLDGTIRGGLTRLKESLRRDLLKQA